MTTTESTYSSQFTIGDTTQRLVNVDIWLEDVNIHIETNDVYYGNQSNVTAIAFSGDIITFRKLNLKHIYFKNKTGGSTATVTVIGTVMERG